MEEGMKRRRLVVRLRLPRRAAILPDELVVEIISWLPVKHVMQLRCVNKFFKNLIFDPHLVEMHLNKSAQQQQFAVMHFKGKGLYMETLSIPRLLRNKSPIFHRHTDPDRRLLKDIIQTGPSGIWWRWLIGSCNGLVCLNGVSYPCKREWLCLWNPAMRTKSKKISILFDLRRNPQFTFSFGYDNSTQTYKVVAFYMDLEVEPKSLLKVFTFRLGDDIDNSSSCCWRDIQCCFHVLPLYWRPLNWRSNYNRKLHNKGVHLNGTINWIVIRNYNINSSSTLVTTVDQYVILSLDLSTETCTQLLLPQRFDKVPSHPPKLAVLMGCLCFCHDFEETHFVIWQMKNFGVQDSWIQLFQISYQENFFRWMDLLPIYLSENHHTLILAKDQGPANEDAHEAFIYNHKYNRVEKIGKIKGITSYIHWHEANDYVESLVSTH
jgi:F-box interacting protein